MNSGLLLIAGMLCKLPEWTTLGNYFLILYKGVYLSIYVSIYLSNKAIRRVKLRVYAMVLGDECGSFLDLRKIDKFYYSKNYTCSG